MGGTWEQYLQQGNCIVFIISLKQQNPFHSQTINSLEYGQITHNEILGICRDRFSETRSPVIIGTGNNKKKALIFYKEDVVKAGKSFDVIAEIQIIKEVMQEQESEAQQEQSLWKDWKKQSTNQQ